MARIPAYIESPPAYSDVHSTKDSTERTPLLSPDFNRKAEDQVDGLPQPVQVSVYNPGAGGGHPEIRAYWWRWVVLTVFCLNIGAQNMIWITESPIADVIRCYYGVDDTAVNWLSSMAIVTYMAFVAPFTWFLHHFGLRVTMVIASCTNAFGASLVVIGTGASYFWFVLAGQGVASLLNVLIWGAAPLLSETWFPANERATATALSGAIAPNSGMLIGLVLSPILIHQKHDIVDKVCPNGTRPSHFDQDLFDHWSRITNNQLFYWYLAQAAASVLILFLTLFAFPNAPPSPPSISRQLESQDNYSGWKQLKKSLKSLISLNGVYFFFFLIASGITLAIAGTVAQVINEIIHPYFPDYDEQVAYLGLTTTVCSVVAMLIIGRILDYTRAYYLISVILCIMGALSVALLQGLLEFQKTFYWLYPAVALFGVSVPAFQGVVYEYAVEITYPLPEPLSASLVNITSQVFNLFFVFFVGKYYLRIGPWTLVGFMVCAALMTVFTRPKLRRVEVEKVSAVRSTTEVTVQNQSSPSIQQT